MMTNSVQRLLSNWFSVIKRQILLLLKFIYNYIVEVSSPYHMNNAARCHNNFHVFLYQNTQVFLYVVSSIQVHNGSDQCSNNSTTPHSPRWVVPQLTLAHHCTNNDLWLIKKLFKCCRTRKCRIVKRVKVIIKLRYQYFKN